MEPLKCISVFPLGCYWPHRASKFRDGRSNDSSNKIHQPHKSLTSHTGPKGTVAIFHNFRDSAATSDSWRLGESRKNLEFSLVKVLRECTACSGAYLFCLRDEITSNTTWESKGWSLSAQVKWFLRFIYPGYPYPFATANSCKRKWDPQLLPSFQSIYTPWKPQRTVCQVLFAGSTRAVAHLIYVFRMDAFFSRRSGMNLFRTFWFCTFIFLQLSSVKVFPS